MQPFEREFLISRIAAGYYRHKGLKILSPNKDLLYEGCELYSEIYQKAKENGVLTDSQVLDFLIEQGLWDETETKRLEVDIPKYIENCKVELYQATLDKERREMAREYIKTAKKELVRIFGIRHSWDHLTCHGVASFAKWQFIIEKCTQKDGKQYDFSEIDQAKILEVINNSQISESEFRELVRNEPWNSIWTAKKFVPLFDRPAIELTEDQKRLISLSCLYDNVYSHQDCPSEEVIEDDDMLDGWLILKKRESQKDKAKNEILEKAGKNANAEEVFIVTDSENAGKVYDINDQYTSNIIKSRLHMVGEKGEVNYKDFLDVKQDMVIKMTNASKVK